MTQFDESQHRRDPKGQFASKGPAAEDSSVELGPGPNPIHEQSVAAYDERIEALQRELREMSHERSKHVLANLAQQNPDAVGFRVDSGASDSGAATRMVSYGVDANGKKVGGSMIGQTEIEVGRNENPWKEFESDNGPDELDAAKIRSWASEQQAPVTRWTLAWRAEENAARQGEHELLREAGQYVRDRYPTARYVTFTEAESGMGYDKVTDAEGRVLHSSDPEEVREELWKTDPDADLDDDYDEFTTGMEETAWNFDERGAHWTQAAADDPDYPGDLDVNRDKHSGTVVKARIDLEKVDRL